MKGITRLNLLLASTAAASLYGESKLNHSCSLIPDYLSCSAQANPLTVDSCCVETFGGLLLQTQFWDAYTYGDQKLPSNSWTIHGLWPDFCNGSYTQYCDLSRQYDPFPSPNTTNGLPNGTVVPPYKGPSISKFIKAFGKYDLLEFMNKYWVSNTGPNDEFWAHEFSKHATCYSTFDIPCYGPKYRKHEDVVEFFETVIKYWKHFPTWEWLAEADIVPSNTTTYSISDILSTLTAASNARPYLGCSGPRFNETVAGANSTDNGRTIISEAWYYMHAYGRVQSGSFVPTDATGGSCATTPGAIHYYARTNGSEWYEN
ncbi:ribonuclease T2 [Polychaeton citri CBS 116435]|uniref:ribonuclease T2 n=1 Tax=Polychaeton citri CBS 116435 TaxID=1314669 RepID=A0A9P4Q619_9PEZI|nr:ribonuclease T2 [Polychaeton citri CBS 116435]